MNFSLQKFYFQDMEQIQELLSQPNPNKKKSMVEILLYIVLVSTILHFGKTLFIPLSFGLLISFLLYPICKWIEKKGGSKSIAILLSLLGISILIGALIYLLFAQLAEFSNEWPNLEIKLIEAINQLSVFLTEQFGVSAEKQLTFLKNAFDNSATETLTFIRNAAYSFSESLFFLMIIPIFSSLILYYRQILIKALSQFFSAIKKEIIHEIIVDTIHEYYNFIKGMLIVYLIVGMLNSIGLLIIGVPHPFLFGFIASLLTFIPYIGIMISALLPIAVSWITYNSIWYPLGVILVFAVVQGLEAYIIFPLAVGKRLRINSLAILIVIIAGGIIWGAAGMILFIPFLSILKLIADRTENLKVISLLLSQQNQVHIKRVKKIVPK